MSGKEISLCQLCGEPMPPGEEMFNYHGYSGPCPKPPLSRIRTGVERVTDERKRQVEEEGFSPSHDDEHSTGELAAAAECYAARAVDQARGIVLFEGTPMQWPFEESWWKPSADPIKNLTRAGALICAEIDRIQRKG